MAEITNYASKGLAGTALGLGIAGTVGLVNSMYNNNNGNGLFGGLFGGNNNRQDAAFAEIARLQAEKYTDQATIKAQKETFAEFRANEAKLADIIKQVTDGFLQTGNAVSRLDKEIECIKTTMGKDAEINELKLKALEEKFTGALALESERRVCGDKNIYNYVNGTFVPGKLVMPESSIAPVTTL